MFVRHGILAKVISDNMTFDSLKYKNFASDWEIEVLTSTPHCPKSNRSVDRNVQTMVSLISSEFILTMIF